MTITLPIRLVSVANGSHGHWTARYGRNKMLRGLVCLKLAATREKPPLFPVVVTLTRTSPGTLDDDNLAYAFKSCRDSVADFLGVKDNDPRIEWRYAQVRGKAREYAVRVAIEAR